MAKSAIDVSLKVTGLEEVFAQLARLEPKIRRKTLREALSDASKEVLTEAKARTPKRTGLHRRSLGRRVRVYGKSGTVVVFIGPRRGYEDPAKQGKFIVRKKKQALQKGVKKPTKTFHLLEFGSARSSARAPLRGSLDAKAGRFRQILVDRVNRALEEAKK